MPGGLGKTKKVAVLSEKENESKVLEYGADFVGNESIFKNVN